MVMRRSTVVALVIVGAILAPLIIIAIKRANDAVALSQCRQNLMAIGMGLNTYESTYGHYPEATIRNGALHHNEELSWLVEIMPYYSGKNPWVTMNHKKAWSDVTNAPFLQTPFPEIQCPKNEVLHNDSGEVLGHYVAISGIGKRSLYEQTSDPDNGVFGYNRKTQVRHLKRGKAQTIGVAETNHNNGPWTAGGEPTVRFLDKENGPYFGPRGQFGSSHSYSPTVSNVLCMDGHVKTFAEMGSDSLLESLIRLSADLPPGELSGDWR
jgi:hypothetical protein